MLYKNPNNKKMEDSVNERMAENGSLELSIAEYILEELCSADPPDLKAIGAQLALVSKIKKACLQNSFNLNELLGRPALQRLVQRMLGIIRANVQDAVCMDNIAQEMGNALANTKNDADSELPSDAPQARQVLSEADEKSRAEYLARHALANVGQAYRGRQFNQPKVTRERIKSLARADLVDAGWKEPELTEDVVLYAIREIFR
jgi:hypothetical protein